VFPAGSIPPPQVHHLLMIVAPDGNLTLYVNDELRIALKIQAKTTRQAGDIVLDSDIVEVDIGIEVPRNCGVCMLFSLGWRKGLFFDFVPLRPTEKPRDYALGPVLAAAWCAVAFQERFTLTEKQWQWILDQRSFLFIGLGSEILRQIITHSEHEWGLERLAPQIIEAAKTLAGQLPELAASAPLFAAHRHAIEIGVKHFIGGDSFSVAHVLYPAVEGILRRHYASRSSELYPKQERLIETAKVAALAGRHAYCLLMIKRFDAFLRRVIFADFNWKAPSSARD
jgi:hypothetical protein